jgi:Leucine-rich repeat (LRR) protein
MSCTGRLQCQIQSLPFVSQWQLFEGNNTHQIGGAAAVGFLVSLAGMLASTSLRRLSVQDNQLSGPIPDASSSTGGTTSKLDCLNLSFNRFDVSLPAITSQRQCRLTTKFQPFGTAFISLKSYN